jgi:hypothetical protein
VARRRKALRVEDVTANNFTILAAAARSRLRNNLLEEVTMAETKKAPFAQKTQKGAFGGKTKKGA